MRRNRGNENVVFQEDSKTDPDRELRSRLRWPVGIDDDTWLRQMGKKFDIIDRELFDVIATIVHMESLLHHGELLNQKLRLLGETYKSITKVTAKLTELGNEVQEQRMTGLIREVSVTRSVPQSRPSIGSSSSETSGIDYSGRFSPTAPAPVYEMVEIHTAKMLSAKEESSANPTPAEKEPKFLRTNWQLQREVNHARYLLQTIENAANNDYVCENDEANAYHRRGLYELVQEKCRE